MRRMVVVLFIFICWAPLMAQKQELEKLVFDKGFIPSSKKLSEATGLRRGQPVSEQHLPAAVQNLQEYLHNEGYLFAHIDSASLVYAPDSAGINIRFYGGSGKRVRFGEINVFSDSIPAQEYSGQLNISSDDWYRPQLISGEAAVLARIAADRGYPFARVAMDEAFIREEDGQPVADINLRIHEGRPVRITDILIRGNTYTKRRVILRELDIRPGDLYAREKVLKIPEQLSRLGIFRDVGEPRLLRTASDSVYLQIPVREGNATTFDGVVGYIPQQSGISGSDGYFTGLVDISFKNLFGSGRKFEVHWKKPDRDSEEFFIAYTEPWVMNYPVSAGIGLERTVRDTTFLEWNWNLNLRMRLSGNLAILGGLRHHIFIPDSSASRDQRLVRNDVTNFEIGLEYDSRDYILNPRSGLYYKSSYTYGRKNNWGPEYLIRQDSISRNESLHSIELRFESYINLWSNQVLALAFQARQKKGDRLQLTDYFWFGGSRSLRGYRESQFRGSIVAWSNLEYRFILGRNARLFIFNDWGYYRFPGDLRTRDDFLPGYGMGLRIESPLGVLGVDYGLGRGDSFRDGKIHFGITNLF